jgi:pumilio family protein 6
MGAKTAKKRKASSNVDESSAKVAKSSNPRSVKKSGNTRSNSKSENLRPRKHADIVTEGKRIWNELRVKTITKDRTAQLMEELMQIISGRVPEIALQHDASRVVQAALQFGSEEQRLHILKELSSNMIELCKSQYAHFVVLKAVTYCKSPECIKIVVDGLKRHFAKLAVHATASRVVECILDKHPKQTAVLKQEFYGPHTVIFANQDPLASPPTLASVIEQTPSKKQITVDFVKCLVNKGMEKQLYGFRFFQNLMLEYMEYSMDGVEIRSMASSAADHTIHLLTSKAGTKIACLLVSYATAKDRKRIIKNLKGYCRSGLLHHDIYLAIIRIVDVTDDTVAVQKNLLQELLSSGPGVITKELNNKEALSPLLELALSDTASKLFLMVLIEDDEKRQKLFDPYEHSVLFSNPTIMELSSDVQQAVATSKKEPHIRRQEILQYLKDPLVELCCRHTEELLRSIPGSHVLRDVYAALQPPVLVDAILDVCETTSQVTDEETSTSILDDQVGHRVIKSLILVDSKRQEDKQQLSEDAFAFRFFGRFENRLKKVAMASSRSAFIIAALCKVSGLKEKVTQKLKMSDIKKLSQNKGPSAGFKALLEELK